MFKCLKQRYMEGLACLGPIFLTWLPQSSGQKQALGNDAKALPVTKTQWKTGGRTGYRQELITS